MRTPRLHRAKAKKPGSGKQRWFGVPPGGAHVAEHVPGTLKADLFTERLEVWPWRLFP